MCGIYGITDHDPTFIKQYLDVCKHRGPDGSNIWLDPEHKITFGHNLLSIMATASLSAQPWKTPNGNVLIYNGEIFNYYELKEKYKTKGFAGTTGCDTELLAWGLDQFGINFIDEIDSMHGFAYYKTQEQKLCLSRDHAGIKPLYYAEVEKGLVFGSEIKGLFDKVPESRTLDTLAVAMQSRTGCNPLRNTIFSGIKQLLPGETLVYDILDKKFIDSKRVIIKPRGVNSFDEKEFRQQVGDAVKRCSIGKRNIGIFLSGGLDSSMIAYELGKRYGKINTFTNQFAPTVAGPEDYNSDARAAKALAEAEGYNHEEVVVTPETYLEAWEQSIYSMEQVNFNPSMAMYCHTNKYMANKGIVITMAGDMGDELLCGYPKYQKLFFSKTKPSTWKELLSVWMDRLKRPKNFSTRIIPDEELINELENCYPNDFWNPDDPVGSYMALDCVTQCPAEFFSRNDTYGMAYSMEGRFPLASKAFMQYCLDIHTKYKLTTTETKIMARNAYKSRLPIEIIEKPKTGWTVPVGYWLTNKMHIGLEKFYTDNMGEDALKIVTSSQKSAKMLIPDLILKVWKQTFKVRDA